MNTRIKTTVALVAVALVSLAGTRALAATPPPAGQTSGFSGYARPGGIEVNLGGGSLRQVACAAGAQPGSRCYLAR